MTDKKSNPSKTRAGSGDGAGSKKPYATLDLRATEVKAQKAAAAQTKASSAEKDPARKQPDADNAKPTAKSGQASDAARSKPTDGTKSGAKTQDHGRTTKPPRRSGGLASGMSHLAAGIVGGLAVLLSGDVIRPIVEPLGITLPTSGDDAPAVSSDFEQRLKALETARPSEPGNDQMQALEAQINATDAKLAELSALATNLRPIEERQEKLVMEIAALEATTVASNDLSVLQNRIGEVERQFETLRSAAGNGDGTGLANLAAITGRISDLETALESRITALRTSLREDVDNRVSAVAEASEAAKSGTVRLTRQLDTLSSDTARLSQQLEVLKADVARLSETARVAREETAGVRSALQAFEGDMKKTVGRLATHTDIDTSVSALSAELDSLKGQVARVVQAESDRQTNAQRIVLSLELGNLKRALERGDSYSTELADVRKAAAGTLDLSKLESFEDTGVPTLATLQTTFRPVANNIIDAARAPTDGTVIDQLLAGARSIVRVRKVNHSPDDTSVEAIVGRMELALEAGQLDQVVKISQTLPDEARTPAEAWLAQVEARRSIGTALDEIEAQLKSSLSGTEPDTASEPAAVPPQSN